MSTSLWKVEEDLAALIDTADMVPDEHRDAYEHDLIAAHMAAVDKRDRVGAFLSHCEQQIAGVNAEIERLNALKERYSAAINRVESMVLHVLMEKGVDARGKLPAIEGHLTRFSARLCPPSVQIVEAADIPIGYCREVPARTEPDKMAIRRALEAGEDVPGAVLAPKKYRLERK